MDAKNEKSLFIELAGMWKPKKENSKVVLSGLSKTGEHLVLFKNEKKKKQNEPDYKLFAVVEKKGQPEVAVEKIPYTPKQSIEYI